MEQLRQNPEGMFLPPPAAAAGAAQQPAEPAVPQVRDALQDLPHGKVQCYNEIIGGKPRQRRQRRPSPTCPSTRARPRASPRPRNWPRSIPLILSDVHAHRLSQHSYLHNVAYLRELQPYPWLKINPATAEKYGIADGDWVRVESPHGWSKFKAEYFPGISPEVVMTKRGWWQACEELGLPGYGAFDGGSEVNNLYNSDERLFDKFYSQMAKQTLVKISRWEEA